MAGNVLRAMSCYIILGNRVVATLAALYGLLKDGVIVDSHEIMSARKFKQRGQIAAPVKLVFAGKLVGVGAVEHMVIEEIRHQRCEIRQ